MHAVDLMSAASKDVHPVPHLLLSEKSFFVLLMRYSLIYNVLFYVFCFLYVFFDLP